jgi:four helix bundle protein
MEPARRFEDLVVWQEAHALVLGIYRVTRQLPADEKFGLVTQVRRAAVSVPANIAEGFRRRGRAEKARFLNMAQASLDEVVYFLILMADLDYADTEQLRVASEKVGRLLGAYVRGVTSHAAATRSPLPAPRSHP